MLAPAFHQCLLLRAYNCGLRIREWLAERSFGFKILLNQVEDAFFAELTGRDCPL